MKNLFLFVLGALLVFTQYQNSRSRESIDARGGPVVLWWATGDGLIMASIPGQFRAWLSNQGLTDIDLRLDTANRGRQKFLMQGVTGVAADLTDFYGWELLAYDEVGLIAELTEPWISKVPRYVQATPQYQRDGRTLGLPRSINFNLIWVNRAAFRRVGMEEPPDRWDFDTFERIGIEYDRKANAGLARRKFFFFDGLGGRYENLLHAAGVSTYNETLTAPTHDNPAFIRVMERVSKWRNVDHLVPSVAEAASFNVEQGFGFAQFQVFARGDIAMTTPGRWMIQQLRRMNSRLEVRGIELPHGGFPCATAHVSGVGIYRGTKHRKEAGLFLKYLASPEYNRYIAGQLEALPPDPAYAEHRDFIHPEGFTNEWPFHEAFAKQAKTILCPGENSPFVPVGLYDQKSYSLFDAHRNGLLSAPELARELDRALDSGMSNHLSKHPDLRGRYLEACQRQRKIDALKAKREQIPLELIDNPFLKAYLRYAGKAG
jgi:multiple sugar transport system substrate-binding protein